MSEIDCYRHELCGLLAGVPVYHPVETFTLGDTLRVSESDLLVGGGSGEHPVAAFNVTSALTGLLLDDAFLADIPGRGGPDDPYQAFFPTRVEQLLTTLEQAGIDTENPTPAPHWSGDTWAAFVAAAKVPGGFGVPYDTTRHGSIEYWMESSLAEYALVSMLPLVLALFPTQVASDLTELSSLLAHAPLYANIVALPSGYEFFGGRSVRLGDGNTRH